MYAYLGDKIIALDLVQLPLFDALRSNGLAVTIPIYRGCPLRLSTSLDLLTNALSQAEIGLSFALNVEQIKREIAQLLLRNKFYDGVVNLAIVNDETRAKKIMWLASSPKKIDEPANGVILINANVKRLAHDPWAQYCFSHQPLREIARNLATAQKGDCGTISDENDNVLHSDNADIFVIIDGALHAPDHGKNYLMNDIMRQLTLEIAAKLGMVVYYENLSPALFTRADEIFLVNNYREIFSVLRYNTQTFNDFSLTKKLQLALREKIVSELPLL